MNLTIKNMVCQRCVAAVSRLMVEMNLDFNRVVLGSVKLNKPITEEKKAQFSSKLEQLGFELIDDRNAKIVAQIKHTVIQQIHHTPEALKINWSDFLSEALNFDYKYLSRLFSSVEGITIEHYIIKQKIEKVKELIIYDEYTLSQISNQLDYSSVAHLSGQFKNVTGMTPSQFKKIGSRKPLDKV